MGRPVHGVDSLADRRQGFIVPGRLPQLPERLGVTVYDGGGRAVSHLSLSEEEAAKVLAVLFVELGQNPAFESRFLEYVDAARESSDGAPIS